MSIKADATCPSCGQNDWTKWSGVYEYHGSDDFKAQKRICLHCNWIQMEKV